MKRDIGFRFSEEVHEALKRKSENWAMTRTTFLERLILLAPVHPDPDAVHAHPIVEADLTDIPTYPPGKPISNAAVLAQDVQVAIDQTSAKPPTRAEREAKNLAFQKQTGMSGGKK